VAGSVSLERAEPGETCFTLTFLPGQDAMLSSLKKNIAVQP